MTNYEWLLQMDGEERKAWFDAEHVDANDVSTRKGDVRADGVCANDGFMDLDSCTHGVRTFASETDSREKLEADIEEYLACEYGCIPGIVAVYPDWLDRQAAITRREVLTQPDERDEQLAELTVQLYELTAERDALADDLLTCNRERESLRGALGVAIDHAHDILQLIDEGMA